MKIKIDKQTFLKSWNMVEKCTGSGQTSSIFTYVLLIAEHNNVTLRATDIRTSIICKAQGVEVLEPGSVALPTKSVSDLFNKASGDFELTVKADRASMTSGKSRYRFACAPATNFPSLPSSADAKLFCSVKAADILLAIERGALCASLKDEFPAYLSSALFELTDTGLKIVSTDQKRLTLHCVDIESMGEPANLLLPMPGLRGLQSALRVHPGDTDVHILHDSAQAYFKTDSTEYAVRKTSGKFPEYGKLLNDATTTTIEVAKPDLLSAIERIDIVVRDADRTVALKHDGGENMLLFWQTVEFGDAVEYVACPLIGEKIVSAFQTKFFIDAIKAIDADIIKMSFGRSNRNVIVSPNNTDGFKCMISPINIMDDQMAHIEQVSVHGEVA